MFPFIASFLQRFQHVEHTAVSAFLPFLEKDVGIFFSNALPVAETLAIGIIKNKGVISDADRNYASSQLKEVLVKTVDESAASAGAGAGGVQITDGLSKLLIDMAYQKLKFTGAIIPSGSSVNVGIAATKVDPATAVHGPPSTVAPAGTP